MHDLHLFGDLVVVLGVALGVAWLFTRLRLPTVVGFLAAGVALGPGATGAISDPHQVELLAEIGIILLLFSIGLEVSIRELQRLAWFVFGGGGLQMGVTAAVAGGGAWLFGYGWRPALFIGLLCGLSSTAIVLNELRESDDIGSVHGRGMLGVLVFQDLAVVPLILITPILAGGPQQTAPGWVLLKAIGVIGAVWAVATYIFPWVAERIVGTRRRELFTMFTVVVAVGTAYASGAAGLSLALGAFLAGLVISESPYSHQMIAEVEPFKDIFNSLFFVSMGLLVSPTVVIENPWIVLGLVGAVLGLKAVIAGFAITILGYGLRVAMMVGLGLAQVGEFSFILAREGVKAGLLTSTEYDLFIVTAVATMAFTPFMLRASSNLATKVTRRFFGAADDHDEEGQEAETYQSDHVIIVGFGTNGKRVARALRSLDAPYVIAELNPETVRRFGEEEPIVFGDAAREPILKQLGVTRARAILLTAGDRESVRRTVSTARRLNPDVEIVARTRFLADLPDLHRDGASHVVVDEAETSLELLAQALDVYGVSAFDILRERDLVRRENSLAASGMTMQSRIDGTGHPSLEDLSGPFETDVVAVTDAFLERETIGPDAWKPECFEEMDVRIAGVLRDGTLADPTGREFELRPGDWLILVGSPEAVRRARDRCLAI